jgi:hypothetical protein
MPAILGEFGLFQFLRPFNCRKKMFRAPTPNHVHQELLRPCPVSCISSATIVHSPIGECNVPPQLHKKDGKSGKNRYQR